MAKEDVIKIIVERITSKGLNPKTNQVYTIDDIKNQDYRVAVEDYILNNSKDL